MITADLDAEIARILADFAVAGEVPSAATELTSAGTWRKPPARQPGSYATSLPFELAGVAAADPLSLANAFARRLAPLPWIAEARSAGAGYLSITVTRERLASLALRLAEARWPEPDPTLPDLAAEPTWRSAWATQASALASRIAVAAHVRNAYTYAERDTAPTRPCQPDQPPVADAVAYYGADAVRYHLSRARTGWMAESWGALVVSYQVTDPWYLVRFAHADAASAARWGAGLGFARDRPDRRLAELIGEPPESELLDLASWLPERLRSAARRHRPDLLPGYLEQVAAAWMTCREMCPALPFGGNAAPREAAGVSARLWLAEGVRSVLAAGLRLIGVGSPGRA